MSFTGVPWLRSGMPRGLFLALALAAVLPAQDRPAGSLTLELRVFNGSDEVTRHTRITVHQAGERARPVAQIAPSSNPVRLTVPAGIYDVQAIQEQDGQVVNIRWANRLIVMPYPDEGGHHLEIVNFRNNFGALQVRTSDGSRPQVALFAPGRRDKPTATPIEGDGYALFVVPAGTYDVQATVGGTAVWHAGIEVPLDRTRFWVPSAGD